MALGLQIMKISLGGRYTLAEFSNAVSRVLQNFELNGIDAVSGANIYVNLQQGSRPISLIDENGIAIEHLKLDAPETKVFKPMAEGLTKVEAHELSYQTELGRQHRKSG